MSDNHKSIPAASPTETQSASLSRRDGAQHAAEPKSDTRSAQRSSAARVDAAEEPITIVLHSSFRSASTWLWSRFRENRSVTAYYEIFNDHLSVLRAEDVSSIGPNNWTSHHPDTAPYFIEYLPLLNEGGGVKGYDTRMAMEQFIPTTGLDGDLTPSERAYIAGLVDSPAQRGSWPVLTCTRTLGRIAGLKRAAPGLHIFAYRNLFQQWNSYSGQFRLGNPYFLNMLGRMLLNSQHVPFLRFLTEQLPALKSGPEEAWIAASDHDEVFAVFVAAHIYLYIHAYRYADIFIDMNVLARSGSDYREDIEAEIRCRCGLAVNLSGATERIEVPWRVLRDPEGIRIKLQAHLLRCMRELDASDAEGRFAEGFLGAMWEEHYGYSMHTSALVQLLLEKERHVADSDDSQSKERDLSAARNEIVEKERLRAEIAFELESVRAHLTHVDAEFNRAHREATRLDVALAAMTAKAEALTADISAMQSDLQDRSGALVALERAYAKETAMRLAVETRATAAVAEAVLLNTAMAQLRAHCAQLKTAANELESRLEIEREKCGALIADAEADRHQLQTADATLEFKERELRRLKAEHTAARSEITRLSAVQRAAAFDLAALQRSWDELSASSTVLRSEMFSAREELSLLSAERKRLFEDMALPGGPKALRAVLPLARLLRIGGNMAARFWRL